jgi:DNA polymerase elongation subunit (family B)
MKKSNETKLAKTFQKTVLQMVASGDSEDEVTSYARNLFKEVSQGEYDMKSVVKRSRLRTPLHEYKSIAGGSAGVYYYNQNKLGNIEVGDSYYYYTVDTKQIRGYPSKYQYKGRVRNVEYIACKKMDEVIKAFPIAWKRLAESEVVKKVSLIYDSLDWDITAISQTGKQTMLNEW